MPSSSAVLPRCQPVCSSAASICCRSTSRSESAPVLVAGISAGTPAEIPATSTGALSLREVERQQILAALEQTGWHRGKTAELLGISPSTLYRRLRDYNLEHRNG